MHSGETSLFVESPLHFQNVCADLENVIRGPFGAQDAIAFLYHAFVTTGNIKDGKGDEQTVTSGVNEGSCCLEGTAEGCFAIC